MMRIEKRFGVTMSGAVIPFEKAVNFKPYRKKGESNTPRISIEVPSDMADYRGVFVGKDGKPRVAFMIYDLGFKTVARLVRDDGRACPNYFFQVEDLYSPETVAELINFVRSHYIRTPVQTTEQASSGLVGELR